jgi:hypothetical protein
LYTNLQIKLKSNTKMEIAERNLIAELRRLPLRCIAGRSTQVARITRTILPMAALIAAMASTASAQANPGDPLYCRPNEGVQFLIVNGGAGVFTVNSDCYSNNINNDTTTSIATGQGGTLTLTRASGNGNYTYTPPTPTFVGLDTFSIPVTTVWNAAGGVGSAGGSASPGGPATLNITLNVIPSTTTLAVPGVATLVPVPAGSIGGCTVGGNSSLGPAPGAQYGCITGVKRGGTAPGHGTLSTSGNTILYTPAAGYSGPDTFSYQAEGVNADGSTALNSGNVTVQVTTIAVLTITTTSPLAGGLPGTAYTQTFAATGGVGPYTFSLLSGSLPPGLSLSGAALNGTPTTPGVYNFSIQVTDSASNTATQAFQLTIAAPLIITTTSPLASGVLGLSYTQTLAATGGVAPYTFSLLSGSLPPGLSLSGAVLNGTPTTPGVYNFNIQVTDSASHTVTQAFALTVAAAPITVPTLGVWGMAILCGSLLLFGTKALARRKA